MKKIEKLVVRDRLTGEKQELALSKVDGFDVYFYDEEGAVLTVGQDTETGEVRVSAGYEHVEGRSYILDESRIQEEGVV